MSNRSLTVVLPVYNRESRLSNCVEQVLELASELTPEFSILIVDDGSTDDTSTVAAELSTRYPQIRVRRYRSRQGLGPIISMVRRRVTSDVVIVHDGVTPIDPSQVRRLWVQEAHGQGGGSEQPGLGELAEVRATHEAMWRAHRRVLGFHLVECDSLGPVPAPNTAASPAAAHRPSVPSDPHGVGQIPPVPRPNFLSAMAQFALGE